MDEITNPHDRFFRERMSDRETAREFLLHYLPEEVSHLLDLRTLGARKDSLVDPELREHRSDLVYRIDLVEGGESFVYVLFEHKSQPDGTVAFQLLRYVTRLWEQALREGETFPSDAPNSASSVDHCDDRHFLGRCPVDEAVGPHEQFTD